MALTDTQFALKLFHISSRCQCIICLKNKLISRSPIWHSSKRKTTTGNPSLSPPDQPRERELLAFSTNDAMLFGADNIMYILRLPVLSRVSRNDEKETSSIKCRQLKSRQEEEEGKKWNNKAVNRVTMYKVCLEYTARCMCSR